MFFDYDEVGAYGRALRDIEAHIYDAGHFLLETHRPEAAEHTRTFLAGGAAC